MSYQEFFAYVLDTPHPQIKTKNKTQQYISLKAYLSILIDGGAYITNKRI